MIHGMKNGKIDGVMALRESARLAPLAGLGEGALRAWRWMARHKTSAVRGLLSQDLMPPVALLVTGSL